MPNANPKAEEVVKRLIQTGLWASETHESEEPEGGNVDRTNPLTPLDAGIPEATLPRTTSDLNMERRL